MDAASCYILSDHLEQQAASQAAILRDIPPSSFLFLPGRAHNALRALMSARTGSGL